MIQRVIYPASSGRQLLIGARQSMPSSSIANCAVVIDTVPVAEIGQIEARCSHPAIQKGSQDVRKDYVQTDGSYIFTDFQLQLDYDRIVSLLMGTQLWGNPAVVVRELLQNA